MNKIFKIIIAPLLILSLCIDPLNAQDNDADIVVTNIKDFIQLQIALNLAESNKQPDVINIGEGTISLKGVGQRLIYEPPYRPKPEMEEHYPLTIKGAGSDKTIIDGAGGSIFSIMTGFMSEDFGATITITDICFKNVKGSSKSALAIGTNNASIRVENCKFINCKGGEGVGLTAGSNGNGTVYVRKCVVDSCHGAIRLTSIKRAAKIEKCKFTNNTHYPALSLFATYGALEVIDNTFTNNATTRDSPVQCIVLGSGEITVAKNKFSGNGGQASGALKIVARNSKITVTKNEFDGNHGTKSGAVFAANSGEGNITVFRNHFTGNRSVNYGGAANLYFGRPTKEAHKKSNIIVKSCLFARNRSVHGSSLYIRSDKGAAEVHNCTFALDTVNLKNAGVVSMCLCNNITTANILNNLFFGNVTKNGNNWSPDTREVVIDNDCYDLTAKEPSDGIGAQVNFSHNILHSYSVSIENTVSIHKNLNVDPLLNEKYKLTANSPGIDAGTSAAHAKEPGKDCAGNKRRIDGNNDGKDVVDIGAFEFDPK